MPVSDSGNLPAIANFIESLNPEGIVELGIGFGLIGAVARNYLDARWGRCKPAEWQHKIIGFEGFEDYRNPQWDVYSNVYVEDFSKPSIYEGLKGWPLVVAIDSIEHLDKTTALVVLQTLVSNNGNVLVSVPLGECPQDGVFGNEFERHRSTWNGPGDFSNFKYQTLHTGTCLVVNLKGDHAD